MTDKRLDEYLKGEVGSYLIPFYWQHGDSRTVSIPQKMKEIYDDGIRSVCVESRPHPDFVGDGWWKDMDTLFAQAQKYGMKVWILDDAHYPSGYAAGGVLKHPELCAYHIAETHVDVIGPVKDGMIILDKYSPDDTVLGVFAYRRSGESEDLLCDEALDLSSKIKDGFVFVDLPCGVWRIFTLLKTRKSVPEDYIDMLNPQSTQLMIDYVYEPHYKRYKNCVGTFAGFFSDEPRFNNKPIGTLKQFCGPYNMSVGIAGMALPWSDEILTMLGDDKLKLLPALWYDIEESTGRLRYAYMDAVSKLYSQNFSQKLGNWCHERGLEYIGHVIEDMDAHARVGRGTGHYFRAMQGQDMSGMDLVLCQVIPGFAHYNHKSLRGVGYADSSFYHYVLPQMCASAARIDEKKSNRAMCEVFGANGWAEGTPMMKWLTDFLIVRGINRIVPHAYNDKFPDSDCPPHFGADGQDPQSNGFRELVRYTNSVLHLLEDATHVANVSILYHAEAEWLNPNGYMKMSVPAKALYDSHICYDIIPIDFLANCIADGIIIVPEWEVVPDTLIRTLERMSSQNVKVCFVNKAPLGCENIGTVIELSRLAEYCKEIGALDVTVEGDYPMLRYYHGKRGSSHVYFLFNESVTETVNTTLTFPCNGKCTLIDVAMGTLDRASYPNGKVKITLSPYQSKILMWNGEDVLTDRRTTQIEEIELGALKYDISIARGEDMKTWMPFAKHSSLVNITSIHYDPSFSGKIKYKTHIYLEDEADEYILELGEVGQTAEAFINGTPLGVRMCMPYTYRFSGILRKGKNHLEIIVANTLANKIQDPCSVPLLIVRSGLFGPVRLHKIKFTTNTL